MTEPKDEEVRREVTPQDDPEDEPVAVAQEDDDPESHVGEEVE